MAPDPGVANQQVAQRYVYDGTKGWASPMGPSLARLRLCVLGAALEAVREVRAGEAVAGKAEVRKEQTP